MSQKNWFVIHNGHHVGPFTFEELRKMAKSQHFSVQQLCWKEGMTKWEKIEVIFEQYNQDHLDDIIPVELPPIPTLDNEKEPITVEESKSLESEYIKSNAEDELLAQEEDVIPPIPSNEPSSLTEVKEKLIELQNQEVFSELNEDYVEENTSNDVVTLKRKSQVSLALSIASLFSILSIAVYGYMNMGTERLGLSGLNKTQRDSLKRVFNKSLKNKIYFRFAIDRNTDTLWYTSNYKKPIELVVKMKPVKGRIFGDELTELHANSHLREGVGKVSKWTLQDGLHAPYGEYEVEIIGKKEFKSEFDLEIEKISKKLFKKKEPQIVHYRGRLLYYPHSQSQFDKELDQYKRKVKRKFLIPLQEQLQRYESYLGLLDQIDILFQESLETAKSGRGMRIFENRYNISIGPLLRDLILDCNRRHLSNFEINQPLSDAYEELMEFGKEIGEIAARMAKRSSLYGRLNDKKRAKLRKIFHGDVLETKEKGENTILLIQKEIKKYQ